MQWIFINISLCFILSLDILVAQDLDPAPILNKLVKARGEVRDDYPAIQTKDRVKNIASYIPATNEIIIEKKAVQECMRLGKASEAALAFIISHELTHFFQHRVWSSHQEEINFFSSKTYFDQIKPFEEQADKYGAFLCYLAGYNCTQIAPVIIERLYTSYQLDPSDLLQYPKPEERKELTLSVCDQVDKYIIYFETAKVLSQFGQYNWSQALLSHLLKYLDFKELYNNAGVNQFKVVLSNLPDVLSFPLVVKPALQLRTGLSQSLDSLLLAAHKNFVIAAAKDPADHDVFINLAAVKLQLEWYDQFSRLEQQLRTVNMSPVNRQRLDVLLAIFRFRQGQSEEALKLFRSIQAKSNDALIAQICKTNIRQIRGRSKPDVFEAPDLPEFNIAPFRRDPVSSEIVDDSDPLFPLNCKLYKEDGKILVILQKGKESIRLLMMPSVVDQYANGHRAMLNDTSVTWFIQ